MVTFLTLTLGLIEHFILNTDITSLKESKSQKKNLNKHQSEFKIFINHIIRIKINFNMVILSFTMY